jgi:hypothetical protein
MNDCLAERKAAIRWHRPLAGQIKTVRIVKRAANMNTHVQTRRLPRRRAKAADFSHLPHAIIWPDIDSDADLHELQNVMHVPYCVTHRIELCDNPNDARTT